MGFAQIHKKGATSKMIEVMMRSSTTGQGLTGLAAGSMTIRYQREGAAANVSVAVAAGTLGTWSSGGWVAVDATNQPGLYQFGIPDAALADGADAATLTLRASGALDRAMRIVLVDDDIKSVAAALLDKANGVESGYTLRQTLRLMAAVLCGKVSGGPGSPVFRDLADAGDRVSMVADASGNRTTSTLSPGS